MTFSWKVSAMYAPEWMLENARIIAGEIVNSQDRGTIIQMHRGKMDLTQEELSRIMRLRRETISRIEHGKVTPTLSFIHTFSGIATLMEAVKSDRSMNRAVEYLYFIRIGASSACPGTTSYPSSIRPSRTMTGNVRKRYDIWRDDRGSED